MTSSRIARSIVKRDGKRFALVEVNELRRLERLAAKAHADETEPAPLPPADAQGNRPAVAFAGASLARSFRQERLAAGLTQQELARLAGVRQETISRLESGKHSPTVRMVQKIDRALQAAMKKGHKRAAVKRKRESTTS